MQIQKGSELLMTLYQSDGFPEMLIDFVVTSYNFIKNRINRIKYGNNPCVGY